MLWQQAVGPRRRLTENPVSLRRFGGVPNTSSLRPFIEKFARANGNPKPGNEGFRRSNWLISGLRNSDFETGRSGHKPLASARQLCQALRVALIPSRRNIIPTAAALALLGFLPVRAGDWPSSARPNRDGVWNETGLLKSFPADGLKVRWRQPVGRGLSRAVVAQGRVFLTDSELRNPRPRNVSAALTRRPASRSGLMHIQ